MSVKPATVEERGAAQKGKVSQYCILPPNLVGSSVTTVHSSYKVSGLLFVEVHLLDSMREKLKMKYIIYPCMRFKTWDSFVQ